MALTAEEVITRIFDENRRLRTRADVLNLLFFVSGSGVRWGKEGQLRVPNQEWSEEAIMRQFGGVSYLQEVLQSWRDERARPPGPDPDPGTPRNFYPVYERCNLFLVPDNVRWDWLTIAFEAAELLTERSDTEENREAGRKALAQLKERFEIQD